MTEKLIRVGDPESAEDEIVRLHSIVSALLHTADTHPFCPIAHWVGHGPVAFILSEERISRQRAATNGGAISVEHRHDRHL
ncbi:MAG TPA: hypothetical protein PKN13_15510 [Accumulibacter sp.]|nr:hypothetical protein [Nitrospira sp.]HNM76708.1 hypothetical protein [Accumulibacter sp.]HNP42200.1 hypothetical protein [Nitrospira sp.]